METDSQERCSFELFKSNVCHKLKNLGDIDFLIETLENDEIRAYYRKKWYPESFCLLAMVDYDSRENGVELCMEYDDLRKQKLADTVYLAGIDRAFWSEACSDNVGRSKTR